MSGFTKLFHISWVHLLIDFLVLMYSFSLSDLREPGVGKNEKLY